ncbi:putative F-box domain-containing protein [Rosa chinensis]|uniref:Putative F-box domain-containing protein n=1 Tax=Rosa chinensis TaxID=74649 RepID=A0A2P6PHQ5_ROSCH|nr:F-box protein At1g22220 [Rosa chinensis]PRQ21463.1 putative F-box domain-containing protein [Rosa chinensis]
MEMDGFDRLPDPVILQIFDLVSDTKTLIRCLAVSKRFNSLVPHTDSLVLTVDRVISSDSDSDSDDDVSNLLASAFRYILKSLHSLVCPKPNNNNNPTRTRIPNCPAQILRCFHRVKRLAIDLPSGDLRLEKGTVLKWRAEFGKTLRTCVILGFRSVGETPSQVTAGAEPDLTGGLKVRVVWTISALIAASARHYLLKEVVREQSGLECLVLRDREAEGTVVMEKEGLRECREEGEEFADEDEGLDRCRTRVPSVRMRMRHVPRLELKGGLWVEGATLVVVRPSLVGGGGDMAVEDGELALRAFGNGLYGEVAQKLLKARSYLLEMNSF